MKKISTIGFIMASVVTMITIQSCQSSKSATAAKMLKFDFEKGKGYDYEMTTKTDQEIMGQSIRMDMSAYYSMDVSEDDGKMKTILTSIDRFKMKMGVMGLNIDVDTDKPVTGLGKTDDGEDPMKVMNSLFAAIKGQKFTMKVNAEGKVQEVTGFENMANTIVEAMGVEGSKKEEMIKKFDEQFNAEKMKEQFERTWYIFPDKEVKVGDSWQKDTKTGGKMGGKYRSTYKVKEIEGDMVTLDETTKINSDDEDGNVSGEITGTLIIDSRVGLVVSGEQEMKLKTSLEGMSFEIKGKTKIKGKPRN